MPPTLTRIPYAEALVAQWLRVNMGRPVYSSLPAQPNWPVLVVKLIGSSSPVREWLWSPRLQVESWGTNKTEAFHLIEEARRWIIDMAGRTFSTGAGAADDAVVNDADDDFGIMWLPDPVTNRDRYILGVTLTLHPTP